MTSKKKAAIQAAMKKGLRLEPPASLKKKVTPDLKFDHYVKTAKRAKNK